VQGVIAAKTADVLRLWPLAARRFKNGFTRNTP
jgi:hypothetical protein